MVRSIDLFGQAPDKGVPASPAYAKADIVNKEGFKAFSGSPEQDAISVLVTNTLSNTFYVGKKELAKETVEVLGRMADKDPEFLAKACVYAREKGLMRLAPIVGLTVLSSKETAGRKDAFRRAFPRVVRIPDDLREFVALCRKAQIRKGARVKKGKLLPGIGGLGGVAKAMTQHSLRHLSEYHAVKYGSAKSKGITLRDILKMSHAKPKDQAMRERFGWLVDGWKEVGPAPSPTNPMIWALERIKRSDDEREIVSLVRGHRLPWEVVVPSVRRMTVGIRRALLQDMPYMALLRKLNEMHRAGVFDEKEAASLAAARLREPEAVERSKQFPFAFLNAANYFKGCQEVREALMDAMEQSFVNIPAIPGRTCVSNDISSSMSMAVTDKSKARACDVAGIFAAAVFKKCEDGLIVPFDDVAHPDLGRVSRRDSIMSIARHVTHLRGGTNLGAPVEYAIRAGEKVDVFIMLTDNEDWAGKGFLSYFEAYKRQVNPKAKAFCVRLASYQDYVAPPGYPDVHFIQGWSPVILNYIPAILGNGGSQVDEVRKVDLSAPLKAHKAEGEDAAVEADESDED